jgi:hypothetical protein
MLQAEANATLRRRRADADADAAVVLCQPTLLLAIFGGDFTNWLSVQTMLNLRYLQ